MGWAANLRGIFVQRRGGGVVVDVMAETADALANGEKWKEEKLAFA